ncbi:4Fe-4S dicluster domain-containing protein [Hydrogenimonas sp. SS33]|uniref:4Fe-4S dicluster domain-containing protein n=1 Tax=Hydrogenimonas leucolamina TaxID=2954236 RepID=UPI00336BDC84
MTPEEKKKRRKFMQQMTGLGVLGLAAAGGILGAPYLKAEPARLRPPGAVPEEEFIGLCIKCGQCLQVCPYDSIILEDIDGRVGVGMAYIEPRERGCYLCEAFPCILACPSGALDHEHDSIEYVHMGIAVVHDPGSCLAKTGKPVPDSAIDRIYDHTKVLTPQERQSKKITVSEDEPEKVQLQKQLLLKLEKHRGENPCTICADMCPYPNPDLAIGMVDAKGGGMLPEIREKCNGCGACVELCPTDVIKIIPRKNYLQVYGDRSDHA